MTSTTYLPDSRPEIEVENLYRELEYVEAVKIGFQANRFWEREHAIYGGISWTDQDITQIWYPPYGYHRAQGVLIGAYIYDDEPALRFTKMSAEQRLDAASAQGERLYPRYSQEVSYGISRAWFKVPYQKGSWPKGYRVPLPCECLMAPSILQAIRSVPCPAGKRVLCCLPMRQ